ncbi:Hypothetical protein A7982_05062 [Minicystis rosea]|nr:Hypothetical protein A7982_05062 [Minicystis rosea]
MTLFETLIAQLVGAPRTASVTREEDGRLIVRIAEGGVTLDGFVEVLPDAVVLDEIDDEVVTPLFPLGTRLHRIHDYLSRFPASVQRGDERLTLSLQPPPTGALWSGEALSATVVWTVHDGETLTDHVEMDVPVLTTEALDAADWQARLDAFEARRATWLERFDTVSLEEVCIGQAAQPEPAHDDGWDAYLAELGLDPAEIAERAAPSIAAAFDRLAPVRARYESLYGLKLPAGIAHLAALVAALGTMPAAPPEHAPWAPPPEAGLARGRAWLDASLAMRVGGLSEWFAPGGLERPTHDASVLHEVVPSGGEGPLDPRLDMRYRRDAPQFVTFLSGDTDGLHWGFWYDSPDHFPVIAHNYARDSAETWIDDERDMISFLRSRIAKLVEATTRELQTSADEELRGYALRRWRALRVVEMHVDELASQIVGRTWDDEPACPWPRTVGYPVGSPPLALRPDAGQVPPHVPSFGSTMTDPSEEQLARWIEDARVELAAGRPAYAHALGLYLHWLDGDELRDAAGKLLLDAYEALSFRAFAAILKLHLLHRDLGSVGIFPS